MKILGAQFYHQSGPDAVNSYKITFAVDESQKDGVLDLVKHCRKGSQLILFVFDVDNEEEFEQLKNETSDETRARLFRRMYAMINAAAKDTQKDPAEIKNVLKQFLISKKLIVSSSKELTISGLAQAIYYLQTEFKTTDQKIDDEY